MWIQVHYIYINYYDDHLSVDCVIYLPILIDNQ